MNRADVLRYKPFISGEHQFPVSFIKTHFAMKLMETDTELLVGVADDPSPVLQAILTGFYGVKHISYESVQRTEILSFLGNMDDLDDTASGSQSKRSEVHDLNVLVHDAPVIQKVNTIIIDALHQHASDIHIEEYRTKGIIRYRIDGILHEIEQLEKYLLPAIISRIKYMANLNILEKRLPQDGKAVISIDNQEVDIRISIVPALDGESVVLRLLPLDHASLDIEQLGFSEEMNQQISDMLKLPNGLIMITGPTGSGKTTTIHSMLRAISDGTNKIITIEDPVEYSLPGITQIQTHDSIGLSFDVLLRRVLRQDPDVIMVGEIRDKKTATLAVRAALTGHLVLSTLHTNDAISAIQRLVDMDIPPYLVAGVLKGIVAQRLIRTTCPACGGASSQQCSVCHESGYKGRTALGESLAVTSEFSSLIQAGAMQQELEAFAREHGFVSLLQHGQQKVLSGITTREELSKVAGVNNEISM